MNTPGRLIAVLLISGFAAGVALAKERGGHAAAGGGAGPRAHGGWHGNGPGGPGDGGNRAGWHGWGGAVRFGGSAYPYRYPVPSYYAYPGTYVYPGYYGYPSYYAYPGYYAYPPAYPYRVYVQRSPTIYLRKPAVVATLPPPPAPRAPAPRFERYTLSAQELFAFDRADLAAPQPKLDEIAAALQRNPRITGIRITGYTDRLGSDAYNVELSQRRADAVKAYLVARGVAADRLVAIGRGEADPVVQCKGSAQAALIACLEPNRRVEIEPITVERPVG